MKKLILTNYSIIAIAIIIICTYNVHKNKYIYNHIPKIDNENSLNNAFKEDIGTALVQGQLVAIEPIDGKYSYLQIKHQTYETHVNTSTDSEGKSHTTISHDWETKKIDNFYAKGWKFYNITIPITQLPFVCHIKTEKTDSDHRLVYEGCNYLYNCTIKGDIKNNYINNPVIYFDKTIDQVVKSKTTYGGIIGLAILFIIVFIIIFYVIKED